MNILSKKLFSGFLATLLVSVSALGAIQQQAYAATPAIYFNPSSASIENGGQVTVQVRANGTNFNAAQIDVAYDASQLNYVAYSMSGSVLPSVAVANQSSGLVKISMFNLSAVSGDGQLLASFTFKALTGDTTSTLRLANTSSLQSDGNSIAPGGATSAISLTNPASPPSPAPSPSPSPTPTTTNPNPSTTPNAPAAPTNNPSAPSDPQSTQPTVTAPSGDTTAPKIKTVAAVGYVNDEIRIKVTSNEPTRATVMYGSSEDKLISSATSESLDGTYYIPLGDVSKAASESKFLYYKVTVVDEAGNKTTSKTKKLPTKPISVKLRVKDKNGNVLGNTTVIVNGREYTTDDEGNVTIDGLYAGLVTVSYKQGDSNAVLPMGEVDATDGGDVQSFEISPVGSTKLSGGPQLVLLGSIAVAVVAAAIGGLIIARVISRPRFANNHSQSAQVYVDGATTTATGTSQPPQHYHPQTVIEPSQPVAQEPTIQQTEDNQDPIHHP